MARTKTFRVIHSRFHFKCYVCSAKRMVTVPPGVRKRSIRCHRCKEITRCVMNRRVIHRDQQYGRVMLKSSDGSQVEVDLFDISLYGVGFDMPLRSIVKIKVGKEVQFHCSRNPTLLNRGRYLIKSIQGRRVGAEQVNKSAF